MVTPVQPFRIATTPDADAGAPEAARRAGPPPDPTSLPDHAGASSGLVARAVRAAMVPPPTSDQVKQRLDAFFASTTATFHTPEGDAVTSMPFRMPSPMTDDAFGRQQAVVVSHQAARLRAEASVGLAGQDGALVGGRATPEQIHRVTQALIDQGALPPRSGTATLPARVRTMMTSYGLGMDCAGYAQQAIMAATGQSRAQAGFKASTVEDLGGLEQRGYTKVDLASARPGDLIVLASTHEGSVGHNVVVRDAGPASDEEVERLSRVPGGKGVAPGSVSKLTVDASWGNHADAQLGGVGRETLFHDEVRGTWFTPSSVPRALIATSTPYEGHTIAGVFRQTGSR